VRQQIAGAPVRCQSIPIAGGDYSNPFSSPRPRDRKELGEISLSGRPFRTRTASDCRIRVALYFGNSTSAAAAARTGHDIYSTTVTRQMRLNTAASANVSIRAPMGFGRPT